MNRPTSKCNMKQWIARVKQTNYLLKNRITSSKMKKGGKQSHLWQNLKLKKGNLIDSFMPKTRS